MKNKVTIGLDQCSKPRLKSVIEDSMIKDIESCECSFFTAFIDVYGNYWHCGFSEMSENKIHENFNVFNVDSFDEIWNSQSIQDLRNKIMKNEKDGCRLCPLFDSINHYETDKKIVKQCP